MNYQGFYQKALIVFAALVALGVGIFVYREIFPEYKTYQYAYKDLETFRAAYTGGTVAPFKMGIDQIVIPDPENGPEIIDRCTSCHAAVQLPHFSPTKLALDVNDNPIYDAEGTPVLTENPDYIFTQLKQAIGDLRHEGRLAEAEKLSQLQSMDKVLAMHPLIGNETRPFEFHPLETYGCTSCHSGNGRALVAKRAHGPVYDGEYATAHEPEKPQFLEVDAENDPAFAKMYNNKPGHDLIFQTTPILTGPLIVASCAQCHLSTSAEKAGLVQATDIFAAQKEQQLDAIAQGVTNDTKALFALLNLTRLLTSEGYEGTTQFLNQKLGDYKLSSEEIDAFEGQLAYLGDKETLEERIETDVTRILGSKEVALETIAHAQKSAYVEEITALAEEALATPHFAPHSIFVKGESLEKGRAALARFQEAKSPLEKTPVKGMATSVDRLLLSYTRGSELYISQACYACHRIAGFSRSSVGPELTEIGYSYPWYVKESIVWPQADLPSSTMPNFRLDHSELADLMAFLMAQKGQTKAISDVDYQTSVKEWESGAKMPWEEPIAPTKIEDINFSAEVFTTQGCAACHKLEGFTSSVHVEDPEWFYETVPENILGSQLAQLVEEKGSEIDAHLKTGEPGILNRFDLWGFYPNFTFARRALSPIDQERLQRLLFAYAELYGLGRSIAPPLNWSGVYRNDAWLMGHFHNPAAYTARSLMPVMPFDDTKFYSLNHLLHVMGQKNRETLQVMWQKEGFSPPEAYELLCSACHGEQRQGNGIIAEWIYPIPKNLRNPVFLRNLTKERAIDSITHGVMGTPMPPWGEAVIGQEPVLTRPQIAQLVDWLYQGLPVQSPVETEEDYQKWQYDPIDVTQEMEREHELLAPLPPETESPEELASYYFEVRKNPIPSPDKELVYIRREFYTPENLAEAKAYFDVNCAACHGKEGGGTGLRATSMVEAKPRMLTNIPWIRTRDDMRLLRSITYGVPGTSMIPWGDQTSAKQRMQLAMYVRELTQNLVLREEFEEVLYDVFDEEELRVQEMRIEEYQELEKTQKAYDAVFAQLQLVEVPEEGAKLYGQELTLRKELKERRERDALYQEVIAEIKEERKLYNALGEAMIAQKLPEEIVRLYFDLVKKIDPLAPGLSTTDYDALLAYFDREIAAYQKEIDRLEKIPGRNVGPQFEAQGSLLNLRTRLVIGLANGEALRKKLQGRYSTLL